MAGNAANAAIWANADVYVNFDMTATAPTDVTTEWGVGWEVLGLLNGEEGFTEEREDESEEHYAWGGLLVKKTKSQHKRTIRFVALEDNEAVFGIVNPGSTRGAPDATTGVVTSTITVPTNIEFSLGFETRDGTKVKRRTCKRCSVEEIAEVVESETELRVYDVTAVLYPQSDGTLYTEVSGDTDFTP